MKVVSRRPWADKVWSRLASHTIEYRRMIRIAERLTLELPTTTAQKLALVMVQLRSRASRSRPALRALHLAELSRLLALWVAEQNQRPLALGEIGPLEARFLAAEIVRSASLMRRVGRVMEAVAEQIPLQLSAEP